MKKKIIRTISVLLAVVLLISSFAGCQTNDADTNNDIPYGVNPLTGRADLSEGSQGSRPVAIMVENSPAARPQWGITTPDLIIEGVVEGGITRMMWIYADAEKIPDKVGPVRSARHDFVEIAAGMNAIYVHIGGSNGSKVNLNLAYQAIENLKVDNIDGTKWFDTYFKRDTTRQTAIEHRAYTAKDYIKKATERFGYSVNQTLSKWTPYNVIVEDSTELQFDNSVSGLCSEIKVTFSGGYKYTFKYNEADKRYYNYLNDKIMTDGNNQNKMAVENVIVLYSEVTTLDTKEGHKEWNLEESRGTGLYISEGVGQRITWIKAGQSAPLTLIGSDGKKLKVNTGQTWMGIIPKANSQFTEVIG